MNSETTTTDTRSLFLIEFYTRHPRTREGGWAINFAWVKAQSKEEAETILSRNQGNRFDEVIQNEQQAEVFQLAGNFRTNTVDANLFFYF